MIVGVFIINSYSTIKIQYFPIAKGGGIVVLKKALSAYNLFSERNGSVKIIKQLFWIFLFSFIGEGVSALIASFIAIPGSVIGMILLFIALHFKWIQIKQVDEVGTWLTDNMGIFFVPAGVGLMANFGVLANSWWQLLIIMGITTVLMMMFVGRIVQSVKRRTEKTTVMVKGERSHVGVNFK